MLISLAATLVNLYILVFLHANSDSSCQYRNIPRLYVITTPNPTSTAHKFKLPTHDDQLSSQSTYQTPRHFTGPTVALPDDPIEARRVSDDRDALRVGAWRRRLATTARW